MNDSISMLGKSNLEERSVVFFRGLKISFLLLSLCSLCTESRKLACLRQRTPFDLIMSFNRAGPYF